MIKDKIISKYKAIRLYFVQQNRPGLIVLLFLLIVLPLTVLALTTGSTETRKKAATSPHCSSLSFSKNPANNLETINIRSNWIDSAGINRVRTYINNDPNGAVGNWVLACENLYANQTSVADTCSWRINTSNGNHLVQANATNRNGVTSAYNAGSCRSTLSVGEQVIFFMSPITRQVTKRFTVDVYLRTGSITTQDFQAALKFNASKIKCLGVSTTDDAHLAGNCNNTGSDNYVTVRTKPGNTFAKAYNEKIGQITFEFQGTNTSADVLFDRTAFSYVKNSLTGQNANLLIGPDMRYCTDTSCVTATPTPTPATGASPTPACVSMESIRINNCTRAKWEANPRHADCLTSNPAVTIYLNSPNATQTRFGVPASFSVACPNLPESNWYRWENYSAMSGWNAWSYSPGLGDKKICVQFKNSAGVSPKCGAAITLVSGTPTPTPVATATFSLTPGSSIVNQNFSLSVGLNTSGITTKEFQVALKFDGAKIKCLGASTTDTTHLYTTCNSNLGVNSYVVFRTTVGNTSASAYAAAIGQVTFEFQGTNKQASVTFDRPFTFVRNATNNQNLDLSLPGPYNYTTP